MDLSVFTQLDCVLASKPVVAYFCAVSIRPRLLVYIRGRKLSCPTFVLAWRGNFFFVALLGDVLIFDLGNI